MEKQEQVWILPVQKSASYKEKRPAALPLQQLAKHLPVLTPAQTKKLTHKLLRSRLKQVLTAIETNLKVDKDFGLSSRNKE